MFLFDLSSLLLHRVNGLIRDGILDDDIHTFIERDCIGILSALNGGRGGGGGGIQSHKKKTHGAKPFTEPVCFQTCIHLLVC